MTHTHPNVTAANLNDVMEFEHVIVVHDDGTVTDAPAGVYAPSLMDEDLDGGDWTLLDGFSGQYRYSGPVMHASEFIGGRMAEHILATPGTYVAVVSEDPDGDDEPVGWAVAFIPAHEHNFGPFERSNWAGTLHRKCDGCDVVSLDSDDD